MTGRYVVGETRGDAESGNIPGYRVCCEQQGPRGFGCTWPGGHLGDHVATDGTGEIYEVWPQATEVHYRVGDDDPTPDVDAGCEFEFPHPTVAKANIVCTWPPGHEGDHVAGDGDVVVGVHPQNDLTDPKEVEATIASILQAY